MKIDIAKLRNITDVMFRHVAEELEIKTLQLEEDYYWKIDTNSLYNVKTEPKELDVGQLSEDWEFIKNISETDEAVSLLFEHIAPLLIYIGNKVGQ